jgi:hypothetical protein
MCSLSRLFTPSMSIDGYGRCSVDRETEKRSFEVFFVVKPAYAIVVCEILRS